MPPRVVHDFVFQQATEGWVVTIPVEVLEPSLRGSASAARLGTAFAIQGTAPLFTLADQIAGEHAGHGLDRAQALTAQVALLAVTLARVGRGGGAPGPRAAARRGSSAASWRWSRRTSAPTGASPPMRRRSRLRRTISAG